MTKMTYWMAAILLLCVFLGTGCRMSQVEFDNWQGFMIRERDELDRQNQNLEKDILLEEGKLKAQQVDADYYKRQIMILEKENKMLSDGWEHARADAKDTMDSLQSSLQNHWFTFMDVKLGTIPSEMMQQQTFGQYAFIIDKATRIPEDASIYSIDMYISKPFSSTNSGFYAVIFKMLPDGTLGLRCWSERLHPSKVGMNVFTLTANPLRARRGDWYGLLVCPGTTLDYNDFGFGDFREVSQKTVPALFKDIKFAMPSSKPLEVKVNREVAPSPGREYAFMMRGITDSKHVFIIDAGKPFAHSKTLGMLTVTMSGPERHVVPKANLVILRRTGYQNISNLVYVSRPFALKNNGECSLDLKRESINVECGDMCALVISPGLSSEYIWPVNARAVVLETTFTPRQSTLNSKLETNFIRIKTLKDAEFSKISFKVE